MKKIFLFCVSFIFTLTSFCQNIDAKKVSELIEKNIAAVGLSKTQLANYSISSAYQSSGITYVYLQQTYNGLPVRNQLKVLSFKENILGSASGNFIENIQTLATNSTASIKATDAVNAAFAEEKLAMPTLNTNTATNNKFDFGQPTSVTEKVTGELMWLPIDVAGKLKSVNLIWTVMVAPKGTDDMWQVFVDATNGKILGKQNFTVHENFNSKNTTVEKKTTANNLLNLLKKEERKVENLFSPLSPAAVAGASYLVIPFPAESPIHPGGTAAVRTNPWTAAVGNASTLGWHSDGTVDYTITRGNNVWATEDRSASDQNTGAPATSTTTPDPLTFNFPPNYAIAPTNAAGFQRFATTNLFYWNNIMHDISYQYGFNEVAGNFQRNNQGRGGNGGDDVIALAQSGTGNNNANFGTPVDGGRPRMRMYLFDAAGANLICHVNTPASIAADYGNVESGFSTANKLQNVGPITAPAVWFDDAVGTVHEACGGAPINVLTGKIAIINRGNCSFVIKVKAAQDAGAVAVVMINNVATAPIIMGGTDNTIVIPAVMVSQADGAIIAAQVANNLNITLSGIRFDGDVDNGIVAHEYGHGISTRLTGGPANSSCLGQSLSVSTDPCTNTRENGSEGWSDYYGLMVTTNWATASINDGAIARTVGTYANGQTPAGGGFRNKPYTTNFTLNPQTYANVGDATYCGEIHNIGEIWCTAIWEMTWGIIQQEGVINPNLYDYTATGNGGNIIAMKLVTEGLKLQPCSPGFIDQRNAIFAADRYLYSGAHACSMWTAFAKRGMGYGASQGSSNSVLDQTASTILPPAPTIATQPVDATAAVAANASFTTDAGADVNLIYQWQVSTNGGTTWVNVTPSVITPTLTLTAVTAGMNGYKYRARVFIGCDISTTNVVTLTVTGGVTAPVITAQPASVAVCESSTATFTAAANGGAINTYGWEVSTNGGSIWAAVTPANNTTTLTLTNVTIGMNNNRYRMVVTNGAGTVNTNAAILTVNPTPTAPTAPTPIVYCQNATPTALTATGTNLLWYTTATGGTGSTIAPTPSTTASGSTIYYVTQTTNTCEGPRKAITVNVNATPAAPLIVNSTTSYCQGSTASVLTPVFSGPGPDPSITINFYTVASGGVALSGAPTPSTAAVGSTTYYVSLTNGTCEGPRTAMTVIITAVPAAPTVITPVQYCQGVAAVALTATGSNLLWYTNATGGVGGATAPIPSTTTVGSTTFYVSQTTGCESPRAAIVVNIVAGTAAPTVTTPVAYCQNATATALLATGSNLLWYATATGGTGSNTATIPSTTTAGSITYYVSQTSGSCESPRAAIQVNVTATPLAPIVTTPVNYCQNATASPLTASGTNLKWYLTALGGVGSATAPTPITTTLGSTNYYVSQSNGTCEGSRATILVTISAVSPAPTVTTPVVYCQNATTTALTATGTNLLWYATSSGGTGSTTAPIPSTSAVGTTQYFVSQNSTCGESPRATISVTVNTTPAAPSVTTPITYCQNATATALVATGSNLLWYVTATAGTGSTTAPIPSTSVAGSILYYVSQTIGSCEGPRAAITVTVNATPSLPLVTTPITYCRNATATALTATGSNLLWYNAPLGGAGSTIAPTPFTTTAGNTNFYVSQTMSGCEGPRALITVTVNATPVAPIVTSPIAYCQGATANALTANGTALVYYTTPTGGTGSTIAPTPSSSTVGSTSYYVSQTINGCEGPRAIITVNILPTPAAPTAASPIAYCQGSTATALTATGTNLLWYNTASGGANSPTATIPSTAAAGAITYYVSQTTGSCEGPRAAIIVNVSAAPSITTQPQDITSCTTTATFSVVATGSNLTYQWFVSTDAGSTYSPIAAATASTVVINNLTAASANYKYRVVVSSGTCTAATSLSVTARVGVNPVVVLTAAPSVNFNPYTNGGLYVAVTPTSNYAYVWKRNAATISNITTSLTKANGLLDGFGSYVVTATDVATGCAATSNTLVVNDVDASIKDRLFVTPNPTSGIVKVSYYSSTTNPDAKYVTIYDIKGARILVKQLSFLGIYGSVEIDITRVQSDTYIFVMSNSEGKKIASEKVIKH